MEQRRHATKNIALYGPRPFFAHWRSHLWHFVWAFCLVGIFGGGMLNACHALQNRMQNAGTKASFLVKFARYVTWPSASGTILICVIGPDPFGSGLRKAVSGKTVGNRKLAAKYLKSGAGTGGCEILFVSPKLGGNSIRAIIRRSGRGTLTVGDASGFISKGGMIEFLDEGARVKFKVDPEKAKQKGLKISSKLLELAK